MNNNKAYTLFIVISAPWTRTVGEKLLQEGGDLSYKS